MKKLLTLAMILGMSTSLVACSEKPDATDGSNTVSVEEVAATLTDYVVFPLEIDEAMAEEIYHIDSEVVEEYAILDTGRSPGVGTIVIVKAKEGKENEAKVIVEEVLADKVGRAFYGDEVEAADNAIIRQDGNLTALFIVYDDLKDEALAKYDEAIK